MYKKYNLINSIFEDISEELLYYLGFKNPKNA